jgi:serine/threonine protein kinase
MYARLLRCLARAAVRNAGRFLINFIPGGQVIGDIAHEAWEEYGRGYPDGALRLEVESLAKAAPSEVQGTVEAAVKEEAAGQPAEVQQALTAYLNQVPASIRRSLRRPSDPTGTTMPATLPLSSPDDLAELLPPRPPRFRPGDRPLPGVDWVLDELVGVGGFGEVWKARHAHLQSKAPVALKFCLDASAAPVLRNEAGVLDRVMRQGKHPGIVELRNTYLSAEPPCLEYEFVEGGDLAGLIREQHAQKRMNAVLANRLLLYLAEIVAFAHRAQPPIVHGDLKPANVLVRRGAGGKVALRITDFGIGGLAAAQAAEETRAPTRSRQQLLTTAVRGAYTPLYASPEQMARRKGEPADPRDDVHALGVIWYQLLTGDLGMMSVPPEWREQVAERGLDEELTRLLASCLASKAEKRPANAAVLAEQLTTRLTGQPQAPRTGPPPLPAPVAVGDEAGLEVLPDTAPVTAGASRFVTPLAWAMIGLAGIALLGNVITALMAMHEESWHSGPLRRSSYEYSKGYKLTKAEEEALYKSSTSRYRAFDTSAAGELALAGIACSGFVLWGGILMLRRRWRRVVVATTIVVIVVAVGYFVAGLALGIWPTIIGAVLSLLAGLPIGILSLVVLLKRDVRAVFK